MEVLNTIRDFIYSLDSDIVGIIAELVAVVVIVLFTILIAKFIRSEQLARFSQSTYEATRRQIVKSMKTSKIKMFNYDELEKFINESGLAFMTNGKMTPLMYMLARIGFALFVMIIGLQVSVVVGLICLPIGYFGVDFIINMSDKADNAKMLPDIENVYDTLRIQTKAGVYITSVLVDCYLVIENKRLKSAFLKMTSDIAAKNDIDEALDDFRAKFRNEYIDTLVIIIKQSKQTGQAAKMFDDIREQISDIDAAMVINEKQSINSKIILVQLLIYTGIIAVAVFTAFVSLSNGLDM